MKKNYYLLLFVLSAFIGTGQNGWIQKSPFKGTGRYSAFGFSIGSKGYVGQGYNNDSATYINSFWEYDTLSGIWSRKADFPLMNRIGAVTFSIGNKGYVATGYDGVNNLNDLWEYDPVLDKWTQKSSIPGIGRSSAVGFSIAGYGYLGTGSSGTNFLTDFWKYDPVNDLWMQLDSLPAAGRSAGIGFSIGGTGYVGLGGNYSVEFDDLWQYDVTAGTWQQKATFPGANRLWSGAFSIGNYGYVAGGEGAGVYFLNESWEYDPAGDSWNNTDTLPTGIMHPATFVIGNNGYFITGYNGSAPLHPSSGGSDIFWEFKSSALNSVKYSDKADVMEIFPNPASTVFTINDTEMGNKHIELTDEKGSVICKEDVTGKKNINVEFLEPGVYYLFVTTNSSRLSKKLVILR